jgi:hypothetical protein
MDGAQIIRQGHGAVESLPQENDETPVQSVGASFRSRLVHARKPVASGSSLLPGRNTIQPRILSGSFGSTPSLKGMRRSWWVSW